MILAAGRGTRLGELGRRIPKALVPIGGRPLLAHQLDYLRAQGARHVVINAHHLAEQIVAFVAAQPAWPRIEVIVEPELLGTAGGVRAALARFDRAAPIVVLYADTIVADPLRPLLHSHASSPAEGTVCVNWLADTTGKGLIETSNRGDIVGFVEKPSPGPPGLASAGLYLLEHRLLEQIPEGQFCDFGHDFFPQALARGYRLRVHMLTHEAHDIGTPDALHVAVTRARDLRGAT